MGKHKEEHGNTRFGAFIKKAMVIAPELIDASIKLASGDVKGAISEVADILKNKSTTDPKSKELLEEFTEGKADFLLEAFELEAKDRENSRSLYKHDASMQKAFGIVFLLGYIGLSGVLIYNLLDGVKISPVANTMITTIWVGTSVKLNTIVDFFFGGSINKK
jgi:hypothetical protein